MDSRAQRKAVVNRSEALSIVRQCEPLDAPRSRSDSQQKTDSAAYANDGLGSDLPEAEHQQSQPCTQDLSVPSQGPHNRSAEHGVVDRYHVYPDGQRVRLSGGLEEQAHHERAISPEFTPHLFEPGVAL